MANNNQPDFDLSPVRFSRLARRGVLLGLSVPQLSAIAIAVCAVTSSLYIGGAPALLLTSPLWLPLLFSAGLPVAGRKAIEWVPVGMTWVIRVMLRQTVYRRRITRPRPVGTLSLPGDAASLREYEDPETGMVMVHDPHAQTLTTMLEVTHPTFILLDPGEQQRRIEGWGRVLSTLCRSGRIGRLQILERTLPDSGTGLAQWWADHGTDDGSWVSTTYAELIERAGPAAERHVTTLSLSLDMKAAARAIRATGGGLAAAAQVLSREITTLSGALRSADITPSAPYRAKDLAVLLRSAYDPAIAATLQRSGEIGHELAAAGPVAVDERWESIRSDSAHHVVLWVSEWPRTLAYPGFLSPLLLSSGIRRSFTLLCDPVRADQAARDLRKKKTEYISDAAQRTKLGQIEDASHTAEYRDVLQQEADLTAGHGVLRYTGLLAITAPTLDEVEAAVALIEQAAIQSSCETRRLVGQQAQAFVAAALPLCKGL